MIIEKIIYGQSEQ